MQRTISNKGKAVPRQRKEVDTSTFEGRFAVRLRTLREKAGFSVDALAEATGLPMRTLYDWESTKSSPPVKYLPLLAETLGVSVQSHHGRNIERDIGNTGRH